MSYIYKILKNNFSVVASLDIGYTGMPVNVGGMTVSHYADSWKQTNASLPFTFEGVEEFIPYVKDVDFCMVIRKKVDLNAVGVNEKTITEIGQDVGKGNYVNNVPYPILDLPPGFTELYRK